MKYYELDKEEQELLEEVERGEWKPVANEEEEKKRFQQIMRNSLTKTKNINIRLSERDLLKLKRKAAESGLPYQTLVSSVLHRFANAPESI
jgi:predicted DNA binding CopG/RHH family protein